MTLTQDRLKQLLEYSPDTGFFHWRGGHKKVRPGQLAGTPDKDGYVHIKIDQKLYKAHRLAWLYVHGVWPKDQIDHINLIKNDNRISNLREANKSQNMANTLPRGALGVKGVYFEKRRGHYCAQIQVGNKNKYLGAFANVADAAEAYRAAAANVHREFARAS